MSDNTMIIAIPLNADEQLSAHFGGSAKAALFEVDPAARAILKQRVVVPAVDSPCEWAGWLRDQGVSLIIGCGMGTGARASMAAAGIEPVAGASTPDPRLLVEQWLGGMLVTDSNPCEGLHAHDGHGHHHQHHGHGGHGHGHCGCSH
jgi:predicted Fe-Mo cluster-binding NifX family protein